MAKDIKINIGGIEYEIQADDLASESTLKDLLDAVDRNNDRQVRDRNSETRAAQRHTEALDEATEELDAYSQALQDAQRETRSLGLGGIFSKIKGGLTTGIGMIWGPFKWVLGAVAGAFVTATSVVVEMTDMLKEMYAAGVQLPLNLADLTYAAARAGMTLEQYSKFVTRNQVILNKFGNGSVLNGTTKLTDMARAMVFTTGGLSRLGLNIEEVSEFLIDYAKIQSAISQSDVFANLEDEITRQRLSDETNDYIRELDSLARVTGQTRTQMNDLIKQAAMDPDLQSTMAALGLSSDKRKNITEFAATLSTMPGGDTLKAAVGQILQFGTTTDEVAEALVLISPNFAKTMHDITNSLRNGTMTNLEAQSLMTEELSNNADSIARDLGRIPQMQRTQAQRDLLMAAQEAIVRRQAMAAEMKAETERRRISEEQYKSEQAAIMQAKSQFDDAMVKLKGAYSTAILRIFANPAVIRAIGKVTEFLQGLADSMLKYLGPDSKLSSIGTVVADTIVKIFDFVRQEIWPMLEPVFRPMFEAIGSVVSSLVTKTMDEIFEEIDVYIADKLPGGKTGEDVRKEYAEKRAEEDAIKSKFRQLDQFARFDELEKLQQERDKLYKDMNERAKELEKLGTGSDNLVMTPEEKKRLESLNRMIKIAEKETGELPSLPRGGGPQTGRVWRPNSESTSLTDTVPTASPAPLPSPAAPAPTEAEKAAAATGAPAAAAPIAATGMETEMSKRAREDANYQMLASIQEMTAKTADILEQMNNRQMLTATA